MRGFFVAKRTAPPELLTVLIRAFAGARIGVATYLAQDGHHVFVIDRSGQLILLLFARQQVNANLPEHFLILPHILRPDIHPALRGNTVLKLPNHPDCLRIETGDQLPGLTHKFRAECTFPCHQLNRYLTNGIPDNTAPVTRAPEHFKYFPGRCRRVADIGLARVEQVGKIRNFCRHRFRSDKFDHVPGIMMTLEDGNTFFFKRSDVVYPSIIHEQIGGPHRGNAQHLMSIVTEMPGNAGAGHTVQQNPQILVAWYSSDGADGAGKIVEMPDPHIGQGDQITPALPEITDRLILIRVGLHDQGNTRADSTTLVFPEQLIHKTIGAGHIEYAKLLFLRSCKGWLKSQKEQTGNDRQRPWNSRECFHQVRFLILVLGKPRKTTTVYREN